MKTVTVTKTANVASGTISYGYYGFGMKRFRISALKLTSALADSGNVTIANITEGIVGATVDMPVTGSDGFVGRIRFNTDGSIILYNISGASMPTSMALTMSCFFM